MKIIVFLLSIGDGVTQQYTAFVPTDGAISRSLFMDAPNPYVAVETADFRRTSMLHHFVMGMIQLTGSSTVLTLSSINGLQLRVAKSDEPGNDYIHVISIITN
jgi:uncharacterized surface protein with fasciclin (FAS1) repeats